MTALLSPLLSSAQDSGADTDSAERVALAGGPNDVREIIQSNDRRKDSLFALPQVDDAISPWLNFKQRLNEDYGFKLGTDYQVLYQEASDSLGEDEAAGGAFRLFFDWTLFGRGSSNPGSIILKAEQRHNLWTDIAPEGLGGELGYAGLTGTGYGDFNWGVTDFFWKQQFLATRVGRTWQKWHQLEKIVVASGYSFSNSNSL